ncbi:hypothetical protein [Bacillus sp. RHFS10]|uniref:hypothetical protein n=1 Tax=Bacillus sp. RHFS10 TaxID=2804501 RepID=UPI001925662E|nr:hypothetical protein [Bacillus sp. RHFS10]MBL3648784.1 hypothetical protein [Bacillus sp. RHFS10]
MENKKDYILELEKALSIVKKANGNGDDALYLTYLTSFGIVQGKTKEIDGFKAESLDDLKIEIEEKLETGKLDAYSMADHLFKMNNNGSEHNVIYLEDVIIKTTNEIESNSLVLFSDQIIGVLPGKLF